MTRAALRLVAGGWCYGADGGWGCRRDVASGILLLVCSTVLVVARGPLSPTIVMFLMRKTGVISTACIVFGAVGGIVLGVWLITPSLWRADQPGREVSGSALLHFLGNRQRRERRHQSQTDRKKRSIPALHLRAVGVTKGVH